MLFSALHDLDVVLIRSAAGGSGGAKSAHQPLPIDLRVATSIQFANANYYMPTTNSFEK